MKALVQFIFPTVKAVFAVSGFLIGLGWASYATVSMMVKAEASAVREEVKHYREIDIAYISQRFDRLEAKLDKLREAK